MSLLGENPQVWDAVFPPRPQQLRFAAALAEDAGADILDVGCATGTLSAALRRRGLRPVGVDLNPRFIVAARTKDPAGEYHAGDMRDFRLRRRFDLLLCLGTTFSYNLGNADIAATLRNFRRHLRPGGLVAVDVLNAIAFTGPRPFRTLTVHRFDLPGFRASATLRHRLDLAAQAMTEQVDWKVAGGRRRRDPEETQRLFFPQELAFMLETAGFTQVRLRDGYGRAGRGFGGRRLIALGRRDG